MKTGGISEYVAALCKDYASLSASGLGHRDENYTINAFKVQNQCHVVIFIFTLFGKGNSRCKAAI